MGFCIFKFRLDRFNRIVLSLPEKHREFLRLWFNIGAVVALFTLFLSILVLLWQAVLSIQSLLSLSYNNGSLVTPIVPGINVPWIDAVYLSLATTVAVAFHEFGHALAAGSEGVPTEYVEVLFLFVISGALIALSEDALSFLSPLKLLRIHCAGIWHNIVLCTGCWLSLKLLPLLLLPMFIHGVGPVVKDINPHSPLAPHLRNGDIIKAINKVPIYSTAEYSENVLKHPGFCIPYNKPGEVCSDDNMRFHSAGIYLQWESYDDRCFNTSEILGLKRCQASRSCSEGEHCMMPRVPITQIAYANSSTNCGLISPKHFFGNPCEKNITYVGPAEELLQLLQFADYLPRYSFSLEYIPGIIEKLLVYTLGVSGTLALLNSIPVVYLDGLEILRSVLNLVKERLSSYERKTMLRACHLCGSILFIMAICSGLLPIVLPLLKYIIYKLL